MKVTTSVVAVSLGGGTAVSEGTRDAWTSAGTRVRVGETGKGEGNEVGDSVSVEAGEGKLVGSLVSVSARVTEAAMVAVALSVPVGATVGLGIAVSVMCCISGSN